MSSAADKNNSLVNHIHDFGINFPLHPSLIFFKLLHLVIKFIETLTTPVILSTRVTELPTKSIS
jgi:hypothetical protein